MISEKVNNLTRSFLNSPWSYLGFKHSCPVCGAWLREFAIFKPSFSRPGRPAECPFCHSYERTRHIWIYMCKNNLLKGRKRMLHVAPEPSLRQKIKRMSNIHYTTTDFSMNNVDLRANLLNLPFCSELFDLIYCSNVLEHIRDDASAISELFRITKSGGMAIIQVPIKDEKTFEDPSVTSSKDRDRLFGQWDHVRYYGRDVKFRFERVGFRVEECWMPDALSIPKSKIERYRIAQRELVHICHKP